MQNSILLIRHRRAGPFSYGGPIYTEAILALLTAAYPEYPVDQLCFFLDPKQGTSRFSKLLSLLRSFFSPLPAKACHFFSAAFRRRLLETLAGGGYGLVVINGVDMLWCAAYIPREIPVLYLSHNIEHHLYSEQIQALAALPLLGFLLRKDLRKLIRLERNGAARADRIITISEDDHRVLRGHLPHVPMLTILPYFTYPPFEKPPVAADSSAPINLGFLGNLTWWPNQKSMRWFLEEVWEHLPNHRYRLHIFGTGSEHFAADGLVAHGFVADLTEVWKTSDIMIQPIIAGGGVNLKVAETLYNRMPTLVTPLALRGMDLRDDPAIVPLPTATDWICFLDSAAPERLRRLRISPENSQIFARGVNQEKIKDFLAPLLPIS